LILKAFLSRFLPFKRISCVTALNRKKEAVIYAVDNLAEEKRKDMTDFE